MNEIAGLLTSPAFWFASLLVSLLVNVAAGLLTNRLEGVLSRASRWWATRTQKARDKREAAIVRLTCDTPTQLMYLQLATSMRLHALMEWTLGLATLGVIGYLKTNSNLAAIAQDLPMRVGWYGPGSWTVAVMGFLSLLTLGMALRRVFLANEFIVMVLDARRRARSTPQTR